MDPRDLQAWSFMQISGGEFRKSEYHCTMLLSITEVTTRQPQQHSILCQTLPLFIIKQNGPTRSRKWSRHICNFLGVPWAEEIWKNKILSFKTQRSCANWWWDWWQQCETEMTTWIWWTRVLHGYRQIIFFRSRCKECAETDEREKCLCR